MAVIADLFKKKNIPSISTNPNVIPDLFKEKEIPLPKFTGQSFLPHEILKTGLEEGVKSFPALTQEAVIQQKRTFGGGLPQAADHFTDT